MIYKVSSSAYIYPNKIYGYISLCKKYTRKQLYNKLAKIGALQLKNGLGQFSDYQYTHNSKKYIKCYDINSFFPVLILSELKYVRKESRDYSSFTGDIISEYTLNWPPNE